MTPDSWVMIDIKIFMSVMLFTHLENNSLTVKTTVNVSENITTYFFNCFSLFVTEHHSRTNSYHEPANITRINLDQVPYN